MSRLCSRRMNESSLLRVELVRVYLVYKDITTCIKYYKKVCKIVEMTPTVLFRSISALKRIFRIRQVK